MLWILAYPLYQLIGTFRHEASHAVVAVMQGARITEFVIWPAQGYWGHVNWEGTTTIAATAAPYICDLLTFLVFFPGCMLARPGKRRWIVLLYNICGSPTFVAAGVHPRCAQQALAVFNSLVFN